MSGNMLTTNNDFQEVHEGNFLMIANSFKTVRLWNDLKSNEINLLTVVMLEIAKQTGSVYEPIKEDIELSVNLKDLAIKSGVPSFKRSNAATKSAINKIHRTLMLANLTYTEGCEEVSNSFFTEIRTNNESGLLTVFLNSRMVNSYLKINKEDGFTLLNVFQFLQLRSKYSKGMFYLLSQWSGKGFVNLSLEDWKKQLFIPSKVTTQDLFRKYIVPALEDLEQKGLFEATKINKISRQGARGITSCQISFKKLKPTASKEPPQTIVQEPTPIDQVVEPTEPQKASDSNVYFINKRTGELIPEAEYQSLDSNSKQLCEVSNEAF